MASNNTSQRTRTDVRRTLFRSLSRSKPSNTAGAAASSSRSGTGGGSPFEDDDGIVVRNEDGEIDVSDAVKLMQAGTGGAGQSEQEDEGRLAELVKRHNSDMARKLPDLLRAKVNSLSTDNWMFEAEE